MAFLLSLKQLLIIFFLPSLAPFIIKLPSAAPITALVAPISLDPSSSLYTLTLAPPSPSGTSPLLLDLDNSNLWRDCVDPHPYTSPTFAPLLCNNTQACLAAQSCTSLICGSAGCYDTCNEVGLAFPACSNYTCASWASISAIQYTMGTSVWMDRVTLPSTDGKNVLNTVTMNGFAFLCTDDTLLKGGGGRLPPGVVGGAGLSKAPIALPSQIASKISTVRRKFAYCLPASGNGRGVIFFGDGPYVFLPRIDVSKLLHYTPILSFSKQSDSYFIQVQSISVSNTTLPINASLLSIHRDRSTRNYVGGTRFSSGIRYTQLEPSIYNTLASEFKKASITRSIKSVASVSPFDVCFDASSAASTRLGYNVPTIDLLLKKSSGASGPTVWHIYGANSVVMVNDRVFCLAFQKTGEYESRSIVVGTYQQQNAFFQFDLEAAKLGILPTLLGLQTTCSNFNFTQ